MLWSDTGSKNESIRLLMERNHLQDVVYVGDTSGDFDACQKADVPFIYASYGFGDIPDPPRQIGAIGELPALLGL
ncbi:MAG: HAD family hydrolase [Coprococcus sp.]